MRRSGGWVFLMSMGFLFTPIFPVRAGGPIRDRIFVNEVITSGLAEMKCSQLAEKNSRSLRVKAFAARLIVEHKKFSERIEEVARHMNITVSRELGRDQLETIERLGELSGAEFDRGYLERIIQDRERAVKAFRREAEKSSSEELKKLCSDALPHLQRDLARARELADRASRE